MYLPVYAGVLRTLGEEVDFLRVPPECAVYLKSMAASLQGLQTAHGTPAHGPLDDAERSVETSALCPLAADLRAWLREDMLKMKEKHMELGDPAGHTYLNHASLLDPRFKAEAERYLGSVELVDKAKRDLKGQKQKQKTKTQKQKHKNEKGAPRPTERGVPASAACGWRRTSGHCRSGG